MKNYAIGIIKDLVISVLIVVCILVILSIVFYDKISLTKVIPVSDEYFLTEEMQNEIEETNLMETKEIIVNYYIDAADLKKYEKTNEYKKGKSNPFSVYEDYNEENILNSDGENNGSQNFYEDDGTK